MDISHVPTANLEPDKNKEKLIEVSLQACTCPRATQLQEKENICKEQNKQCSTASSVWQSPEDQHGNPGAL
jgi:hypothetical protein